MENIETLFFDESGTPAVSLEDGLFVVGGFSIRGDINPILREWDKFLSKNKLHGKKGKKYKGGDFLNLSEFMCKHKIIPITTHSRLNDDDLALLESKIIDHNKIALANKKYHEYINQHDYLWTMQVAITVASSILSLIMNRGVISKVQIAVDEFLKKKKLQSYVSNALEKFFEKEEFKEIFRSIIEKYSEHPDIQNLIQNFQPEERFISLDWNARGKLALLADVVCSMYKRSLKRESGVVPAWDVLKICFKDEGKTPSCIGNDLTNLMKNVVLGPWII